MRNYPKIVLPLPKYTEIFLDTNQVAWLKGNVITHNQLKIQGFYGEGKSTAVTTFIHSTFDEWEHIVWINGDTPPLLIFKQIQAVLGHKTIIENQIAANSKFLLRSLFVSLNTQLSGRALLVVDNYDINSDYAIIEEFNFFNNNWRTIIITNQASFSNADTVRFMPPNNDVLIKMFKHHSSDAPATIAEIQTIINLCGKNALAIEAFATLLKSSISLTPQKIINSIKNANYNPDFAISLEMKSDNQTSNSIFTIIAACLQNFSPVTEEELKILYIFSHFENGQISRKDLFEILNVTEQNAFLINNQLNNLTKHNFLIRDENNFICHHVIRMTLDYQAYIPIEQLDDLLTFLIRKIDYGSSLTPIEKIPYGFAGHSISKKCASGNLHMANLLNALNQFWDDLGQFEKAVEVSLKEVAIKQHLLDSNDPSLGNAYHRIGVSLLSMGDYDTTETFLSLALAVKTRAFGGENAEVGRTLLNFAVLYSTFNDQENAEIAFQASEAMLVADSSNKTREKDLFYLYNNLGHHYLITGEYHLAIQNFNKAIEIKNQGDQIALNELLFPTENLAICFFKINLLEEALKKAKEALRMKKRYFGDSHTFTGDAYALIANILLKMNKNKESAVFTKKANLIFEKNFTAFSLTLDFIS